MMRLILFGLVLSTNVCSAHADDPWNPNLPDGRQLVVRKVCSVDTPHWRRGNGTLSFDGRDVIIIEPQKKLSLYGVQDLKERIVREDPLIESAWSDSATGGIFVMLASKKPVVKEKGKQDLQLFDLLHFASVSDLMDWNPKWIRPNVTNDAHIQWIPGANLFFLQDRTCTLINDQGNQAGEFRPPGIIYAGLDTSEDGIEVYFQSKAQPNSFILRGVLDSKLEKVTKIQKMLPSAYWSFSVTPMDTRTIRHRGLRPGDMRRFIEWTNQPLYAQHDDQKNIDLDPAHLDSLRQKDLGWPRISERGVLSAAESADSYTLVPAAPKFTSSNSPQWFPPFAFRRSGEIVMLPILPTNDYPSSISDAVLSDETWVISLQTWELGARSQQVTNFWLYTIGDASN